MSGDLISRSALLNELGCKLSIIDMLGVAEIVGGIPTVEAEPVVHAHWEDVYGGKYANQRYRCSRCKKKAQYRLERDLLLSWKEVQELTPRCPYCGAHMDEEVADGN